MFFLVRLWVDVLAPWQSERASGVVRKPLIHLQRRENNAD
jgi:hypothetical protein